MNREIAALTFPELPSASSEFIERCGIKTGVALKFPGLKGFMSTNMT
jgi:hypothetical protein